MTEQTTFAGGPGYAPPAGSQEHQAIRDFFAWLPAHNPYWSWEMQNKGLDHMLCEWDKARTANNGSSFGAAAP